ncbi:hypothetical protein NKR23_g9012 [Pleurostoma richardsiae]|uniref:Uncharacterized protein n=1 Tax=Pleurostoma richardsiae TaxID=41990 RepID=A0AA38VKM7_9PEZI|nr:hypothetical protein NKR23_g9012 [Pleurostoma richardsiae]
MTRNEVPIDTTIRNAIQVGDGWSVRHRACYHPELATWAAQELRSGEFEGSQTRREFIEQVLLANIPLTAEGGDYVAKEAIISGLVDCLIRSAETWLAHFDLGPILKRLSSHGAVCSKLVEYLRQRHILPGIAAGSTAERFVTVLLEGDILTTDQWHRPSTVLIGLCQLWTHETAAVSSLRDIARTSPGTPFERAGIRLLNSAKLLGRICMVDTSKDAVFNAVWEGLKEFEVKEKWSYLVGDWSQALADLTTRCKKSAMECIALGAAAVQDARTVDWVRKTEPSTGQWLAEGLWNCEKELVPLVSKLRLPFLVELKVIRKEDLGNVGSAQPNMIRESPDERRVLASLQLLHALSVDEPAKIRMLDTRSGVAWSEYIPTARLWDAKRSIASLLLHVLALDQYISATHRHGHWQGLPAVQHLPAEVWIDMFEYLGIRSVDFATLSGDLFEMVREWLDSKAKRTTPPGKGCKCRLWVAIPDGKTFEWFQDAHLVRPRLVLN